MQSQIGRGEQTYAQAKELLDSWRQLELEWSTCALPGIQDGTVQTKVSQFVEYVATALAWLTKSVPSLPQCAPRWYQLSLSECTVTICACRRVLKLC